MSLQLRRLAGIFCTLAVLWGGATLPPSLNATAGQPGQMRVRLETSKGAIVIEVHRDWAPRGADRFLELVTRGYFDDSRFFRVVKGQWAQFGINGDPASGDGVAAADHSRRSARTVRDARPRGVRVRRAERPDHAGVHRPARPLVPGRAGVRRRSARSSRAWTSPTRSTASTARPPAAGFAPASSSRCSTAATRISIASSRVSIAFCARESMR